jgi:hypothetical protein
VCRIDRCARHRLLLDIVQMAIAQAGEPIEGCALVGGSSR